MFQYRLASKTKDLVEVLNNSFLWKFFRRIFIDFLVEQFLLILEKPVLSSSGENVCGILP